MQPIVQKISYCPPSHFEEHKEDLVISTSMKVTAAFAFVFCIILKENYPNSQFHEFVAFFIPVAIVALAITLKLRQPTQIHAVKVLKKWPSLKNRGYKVFRGDETFSLAPSLYPEYKKLLELYRHFPKAQHRDRIEYDSSFTKKRQFVTGIYSVCNGQVVKLQNSLDKGIGVTNHFLRALLVASYKMIPEYNAKQKIRCQLLLTRHTESVPFLAIHQDGFYGWLVQYNLLYSSSGISGGKIQIITYSKGQEEILEEYQPSKLLDGHIINNNTLFHSATKIKIDPGSNAERLTIIFRFIMTEMKREATVKRGPRKKGT